MSPNKHTPGPFTVRQPDSWPFDIEVVNANGDVVWSERRYAHSTKQKNLTDCLYAVGFDRDERPDVMAGIERQLADIHLRAAAPDLLEALKALQLQALQSNVNSAANEWGREALEMAKAAIEKAEGRTLPLNAEGGDK